MKRSCRWSLLAGFIVALVSWSPASGGPEAGSRPRFWFRDVAKESGIDFCHTFGAKDLLNIVETTGTGCAFFDYDGDGLADLFFVNDRYVPGLCDQKKQGDPSKAGAVCRLYRNRGDRRFDDVTELAGLAIPMFGMGCTTGDYDSDGYPDLYVTCYGANHLFRNRGDGTFVDATARAGVGLDRKPAVPSENFSVAASFLDYDKDGNLDLFVANYLVYDPAYHMFYPADAFPGPLAYSGQPDSLFCNNGDGTFTDVSIKSGVNSKIPGRSMGASVGDIDGDGWIDIFVANDKMQNYLYLNQKNGTFRECAIEKACAHGLGGEGVSAMAVEFADLGNTGCFDAYVTAGGVGALYKNDLKTRGRFSDMTTSSGIAPASAQYVGWGGGVYDMDNDGILDLIRINGEFNHLQPQEDLLFAGQGAFRFEDVSSSAGPYYQVKLMGRGAAFADYDLDGLIDFAIVNLMAQASLIKNESGVTGNWLRLELVGTRLRDPIGTRVLATVGSRTWLSQVRGGSGYLSQSERIVHLGLGRATRVDRVEVLWDGSPAQVLQDLPANRVVRIVEPAAPN
ncbi:MAG: CRTAC1 family protein [Candidatus Riflebacteria bacterium]|nr:CRTAC1 family protein [Candidatus Riflebacteria bacterium]